jgi:hypothetical protein
LYIQTALKLKGKFQHHTQHRTEEGNQEEVVVVATIDIKLQAF